MQIFPTQGTGSVEEEIFVRQIIPPVYFFLNHIRSKRDDKQILFLHFEMNKLDLRFFVSRRRKKRLLDLTFSTVFLVLKYTFFFRFHRRIFSTLYFEYLFSFICVMLGFVRVMEISVVCLVWCIM